jgi:hypothetical protein
MFKKTRSTFIFNVYCNRESGAMSMAVLFLQRTAGGKTEQCPMPSALSTVCLFLYRLSIFQA